MNDRKRHILGVSMLMTILTVFVAGMIYTSLSVPPAIEKHVEEQKEIQQKKFQLKPLADANPSDNTTGFEYGMIYLHQADPGTAYASNLSNASAYEYSDSLNASMTGETPYTTAVDIVYKFQINDDDGYNYTGSTWEDSWLRAYLNESLAWSISAEAMTMVSIANDGSGHRWVHFYLNNGGSGYQLSKGQAFNMSINLEIYS